LGAVYLKKNMILHGAYPMALYLLVLLGATGLILTRDIFNAFVFLEILSIATYSLIGIKQNKNALAAGIKYMLAGGIASFIMLIGIIFIYRYTGTLNIDTWQTLAIPFSAGYQVALFLVAFAVLLELKPFPANGWALDLYTSVHSGLGAVISSINTGAVLFLFYKLLPLFPERFLVIFAGAGLISFVMGNLIALRQQHAKRLLGYSSTAQTGLLIFILSALSYLGIDSYATLIIVAAIFFTNFLAKSGLFWLSGMVGEETTKSWSKLKQNSGLFIAFGIFIFSLIGMPPFPVFYAKFTIVQIFAYNQAWFWLGLLLFGSLLEAAYLLRWFGQIAKGKSASNETHIFSSERVFTVLFAVIALVFSAFYSGKFYFALPDSVIYPLWGLVLFSMIDFLSVKIKGFLAMILLGLWAWFALMPELSLFARLFIGVLVGGSLVQLFAFMGRKKAAEGLMPILVMLIFSMGNLVIAGSKLEFFLAWEFIAFSSYLLILRGKKAESPALTYILFSLFGAYLLLIGLMLAPNFLPHYPLIMQITFFQIEPLAALFIGLAFLIKIGAAGVHVWLPAAYAEAEEDTTSLLSSVLSKVGVFGLFLILIMSRTLFTAQDLPMIALGWLGVFTAFIGALMAVFQEDVKKLLAYSSMSQLGYAILGLSLMSHLGWVSALYLTINHLFFKALIFIAIAAVIMRTGTKNMYEMGGLIKKMPIAFVSVLMGIIAVSGVPPLSGFGSKWFIYTSLIEQGRYLETGLAFFASAIAFLYLYKLIQTVFLGQAKPAHKEVKEAPVWMIIPQGIFIMAIMAISMFPNLLTQTLSLAVGSFMPKPEWLTWDGYNIIMDSPVLQGNWNGNLVMMVTMGVFGIPLVWLLLTNAKVQKVKQFNIVFAAERPLKPATTHFAYNMYSHYYKALGFWVQPRATRFYRALSEWTHSMSATFSRIYTGNAQTYMLHIFLYMIVLYWILGVKS
jgi:formate hydrogenlyase subunit 3/multisubunit Na+/H+ antiporter MnhD subunit